MTTAMTLAPLTYLAALDQVIADVVAPAAVEVEQTGRTHEQRWMLWAKRDY